MLLDEDFWNERYINQETGWDMHQPSPPLIEYADGLADKTINILIPGCGNAHEAKYLYDQGFINITLLDISAFIVAALRQKYGHAGINIIHQDFFMHQGHYDLILEQTFFCALAPDKRPAYVSHTSDLLKPGGRIAGVLFNDNIGFEDHPPFRGGRQEYLALFSPYFEIQKLENCYNSIKPRRGNELFFEFIKKGQK